MKKKIVSFLSLILVAYLIYTKSDIQFTDAVEATQPTETIEEVKVEEVEEIEEVFYEVVNDNMPFFEELTTESYEHYSELDELGRCGVAEACLGLDTMSTDARESIGHIKPTGWKSVKYDFIEGGYLYNRCHLIGYQLSGENANKLNLITGTRAFNVDGMLPFEDMVADYIKETGNHVMYRVTPHFAGDEFVARGVYMEAKSVEDDGEGIEFNVYVYNKQRGVIIDYATGEPRLSGEDVELTKTIYSVIKETGIFHREWCIYADSGKRELWYNEASEMERLGYKPCSLCLN